MYCNPGLINNAIVGDVVAPLLSVVPYDATGGAWGTEASFSPNNVQYVPLIARRINSISIEIRTKTGIYTPFSSGSSETLAVLHVKKVSKYAIV